MENTCSILSVYLLVGMVMRCPNCDVGSLKTIDSRACMNDTSKRRRLECVTCGDRFTSVELILNDDCETHIKLNKRGCNPLFERVSIDPNDYQIKIDIVKIRKAIDYLNKTIGLRV